MGPSGDAVDTPRHRALASPTRVAILHLARRAEDGITAAQVAAETGLHLTTVREHLDRLAEAGLLTRYRHAGGSPGRPAWRYRPAAPPEPSTAPPGPYRDLAAALVGHLARNHPNPRVAGVAAGQDWGRKLVAGQTADTAGGPASTERRDNPARPANTERRDDPARRVDTTLAILDQLGFSPRVVDHDDRQTRMHLYTCPFLDLVDGAQDVVCGVHLGVIRGAIGAVGGAADDADLEPFGAPHACVVRIATPRTR